MCCVLISAFFLSCWHARKLTPQKAAVNNTPSIPQERTQGAMAEKASARRQGARGAGSKCQCEGVEQKKRKRGMSAKHEKHLVSCTSSQDEVIVSTGFLIKHDASVARTGWQGCAPPKKTQKEINELYQSEEIVQLLCGFFPIPYLVPAW